MLVNLTFFIFKKISTSNSMYFLDDLIGEAVLPVSDLCSNLASKRIIQLHKYGTTKTGSLTAEVSNK
jgi:hypothetical protein